MFQLEMQQADHARNLANLIIILQDLTPDLTPDPKSSFCSLFLKGFFQDCFKKNVWIASGFKSLDRGKQKRKYSLTYFSIIENRNLEMVYLA